jgi:6-pyruvoyltetrahydropterin/6-carboxytetrahydropterin synthase
VISCTKRLTFAAGHRVWKHESKCANFHGHNYAVLLEAIAHVDKPTIPTQKQLDLQGRIIDFGVLKKKFGRWIDENWDHGFIVYEEDKEAVQALKMVRGTKIFQLPYNPTAENLAIYIMESLSKPLLRGTNVKLRQVTVWETETCFATVVVP